MEKEITVTPEQQPMTADQIRANVNLIQQVMESVMVDGTHYGKIPGTDNPTLYKPGAEKIMSTFRLAASPEIVDLSTADAIRYRVTCNVTSPTGQFLGAGVGECSTDEAKYKWRSAVSVAEFNATPEDRRRLKHFRNNTAQQVRTEPADLANTVLKMAKKRALVDAILTVTAASDIFTQDVEDMPTASDSQPQAASVATPAARQGGADDMTDGQRRLIEHKLAEKSLSFVDLSAKWPDGVKKNQVNDVLAWIKEQGGKDAS